MIVTCENTRLNNAYISAYLINLPSKCYKFINHYTWVDPNVMSNMRFIREKSISSSIKKIRTLNNYSFEFRS